MSRYLSKFSGVETTTDWITAIGSSFAAVGTVGAVIVALWQTQRQERFGLQVDAKNVAVISADGNHEARIRLTGVNHGRRPITINDAALDFTVGPMTIGLARVDDTVYPITLQPGEQTVAAWDSNRAEQARQAQRGSPFTHCEFIDSLGNSYSAPVPGMKVSRWNWRLRREYVTIRS